MWKDLKIFILILISSIVTLLFLPSKTLGQGVLFSDDFNDGNANGWDVIGSPGWNVQNGQYGIFLNPGLSNSVPADFLWNFSWTNISYEVDLRGAQGVDKNILVKFKDISNFIELHANDQGIVLEKASNQGGASILASSSQLLSNGTPYHFKFEIANNSSIKVYMNGVLLFEVNETLPIINNWKIGLRAGTGGTPVVEVWFDNVVVSELSTPTPTPTPTSTPSPTPTPTPIPTIGPFELPFNYTGRLGTDQNLFKNGFWQRLTAAFDHVFATGTFRPFTGNTYSPSDCPSGTTGIACYDSHNGTDFSTVGGQEVFSVSSGTVSYVSAHGSLTCTPEASFGCVVIAKYSGNTYGLFAHLDKIFVNQGGSLNASTQIGEMGVTGCPGCGEHLHFGVLKPVRGIKNSLFTFLMGKKDWQGLLSTITSTDALPYQPACTYSAPNGTQFYFSDPSGWKGTGPDPWTQPKNKGGCGVSSPYLWKYDIGTSP
ncbi:M23 family metallopeptidase [Candidatus Woesebacteria bacterium]|nr:M23 family metallopeptidase [Candidatus Woesebacteria bacterium]